MKYKAKPIISDYGHDFYSWIAKNIDDEGYVHGFYVDGYIVGGFVEVNSDYANLEYWVPIEEKTLKEVTE